VLDGQGLDVEGLEAVEHRRDAVEEQQVVVGPLAVELGVLGLVDLEGLPDRNKKTLLAWAFSFTWDHTPWRPPGNFKTMRMKSRPRTMGQ